MIPSSLQIKKTRLLFIGPYPPPYGGIASLLKPLIPSLLKAEAEDVAVVTFGEKNSVANVDGATIYRFNIKKNVWRIFLPTNLPIDVCVIKKLFLHKLPISILIAEMIKSILIDAVARSHKSQIISAYQTNINIQLIPLNTYWRGNKDILLTVFGELYESSSEKFMYKHAKLFNELLSIPKRVLASSRHCANSFKKIGFDGLIDVVFVGVEIWDPASLSERIVLRKKIGINKDDILIFFMGRMLRDMGLDVVISTAEELIHAEPNARLLIAGATGELTTEARVLSEKYPKIIFTFENISFDMQREFYMAADILVAPSFNQRACMGVSIKEAMAASLPVVGGAGGGISEAVVHGETGYLVPVSQSGSVDSVQYLEALYKLISDKSLRQSFGAAGRKRAEEIFSVDATNRRYIKIIQEINRHSEN
jgi:glycosyltransferase involved in cell wall biosynthesis